MHNLFPKYDNYRFVFEHNRSNTIDIGPHLHDGFEIYYLISGDVNYFIENKIYELEPGNLMITNQYEIHTPIFKSDKVYERIFIQFNQTIANCFYMKEFDLLQCFNNRAKGEKNRIVLNQSQSEEILTIFKKLEACNNSNLELDKLLQYVYLNELLILLNKAFLYPIVYEKAADVSKRILPIMEYIADNLEGDLSLDFLSKKFFISKTYLSRLFKKNTGINLHEYILYNRLAYAKELLLQGHSVTKVCNLSGFSDYSNFIRIFKRVIGVPPGMFKKI